MAREEWDKLTTDEQFEYATLCDAQLTRYEEVLLLMPPCPEHGNFCLSHYKEWLASVQTRVG